MSVLLDKAQAVVAGMTAQTAHAVGIAALEKQLLGKPSRTSGRGIERSAITAKAIFDFFDYLAVEYGLTELVGPDIAGGHQAQILEHIDSIINKSREQQA